MEQYQENAELYWKRWNYLGQEWSQDKAKWKGGWAKWRQVCLVCSLRGASHAPCYAHALQGKKRTERGREEGGKTYKTKSSQSHHLPFVHLIHASVTFGASWDQALCSGMQLPHLSEMRCSHSGFLVTSCFPVFFPPSPCVCGFLCGCSFCICHQSSLLKYPSLPISAPQMFCWLQWWQLNYFHTHDDYQEAAGKLESQVDGALRPTCWPWPIVTYCTRSAGY